VEDKLDGLTEAMVALTAAVAGLVGASATMPAPGPAAVDAAELI
jgi:hypothetical protein